MSVKSQHIWLTFLKLNYDDWIDYMQNFKMYSNGDKNKAVKQIFWNFACQKLASPPFLSSFFLVCIVHANISQNIVCGKFATR